VGNPLPVEFLPRRSAVRACPAVSGLRGQLLLQALHQLSQLGSAHPYKALHHRCRRRRLAGQQPRAQVARQCHQFPNVHGGDLRRHRRQRERVKAAAGGLLQQGAEPVERARGSVPYGAGLNPSLP